MKRKKILPAAVTVLTLLLCAALCASVLTLYFGGAARRAAPGAAAEDIFTRAAVGRQLLLIVPVAVLWLAAVLAAAFTGCRAGRALPRDADTGGLARQKTPRARRIWLRIVLYAAAVVLLVLGILNGGGNDVLVKAIRICTECIGLG